MDSSLLEYARFHGIASDYAAVNPLTHIDDTFQLDPAETPLPQKTRSECDGLLRTARDTLDKRIRGEKLRVSKGSARFLTSLIHEAQMETLDINWDTILPEFHRYDDVRIEPPIFSLRRETDVRLSKKQLRYSGDEVEVERDESDNATNGSNHLGSQKQCGASLIEQVKNEKIRCSREALSLIQSVKSRDGQSVEELEGVLESMLERAPVPEESPVLLSLNTHDVPPSPTPVPDGFMLPSPVSSASIELDFYWRHKASCVWRLGDDTEKKPQATISTQHDGHARPEPAGEDRPEIHTSSIYTKQTTQESFIATEDYNAGKALFEDGLATTSGFFADGISSPIQDHEPCSLPNADEVDNGISFTPATKALLSEDKRASVGTSIEWRGSREQQSGVGLQAEPPEASPTICAEFQTSRPKDIPRQAAPAMTQQGSKRRKLSPEPSLKQSRESQTTRRGTASIQKQPDSRPPRMGLGSLSSFMETRGKAIRKHVPAESPYFASKEIPAQDTGPKSEFINNCAQPQQRKPEIPTSKPTSLPSVPAVQIPRVPPNHEGIVLFISTSLLKTSLPLVQSLEGAAHPPKIIYRDYADKTQKHNPKSQAKLSTVLPGEADIIISPKIGIVLTTSQATMQLYLPGHKPPSTQSSRGSTIIPNAKSINSPLRETIFRLASRYEQLYIFITHNPDQSKRSKARVANPHFSADKHLLGSLTSLSAFCTSLSHSGLASVAPLLVPSIPDSISAWVLALAHKHVCSIPPPRTRIHPQSGASIGFTPVNPKPQLDSLLGDAHESAWEGFLRRTGLNPYAAQVVLAVLRENYGVGGLAGFVEMMPQERRVLFGGVLGERVLSRVEALIERDWHCDWALNFDGVE